MDLTKESPESGKNFQPVGNSQTTTNDSGYVFKKPEYYKGWSKEAIQKEDERLLKKMKGWAGVTSLSGATRQ